MDIPPQQVTESEEFQQLLRKYTLEYQKVSEKGTRGLYLIIMRDDKYLFQTDEPSVFQAFGQFNPICIGVVNKDGIPYGLELVKVSDAVYDEEDNLITEAEYELQRKQVTVEIEPATEETEGVYETQPHPIFELNIAELMSNLPPKFEYEYNEAGEVINTTQVAHTEPFLPIIPSGWKKPDWELISKYIINN